jgi:outer membrane receptor for ferrienterochelin and colicin
MLGEEWDGLAFGTNFTYMQSEVTLSQFDQQQLADYGVNASSQPMTATPDFLFNANLTYDYRPLGTSCGIFYTLKGNSLVSAANPHTVLLTPAIYQLGYGTLNASVSQEILQGLRFTAAAKNLTNPDIQTQYQTYDGVTGLNSKYTAGIAFSFAFTYQVNF